MKGANALQDVCTKHVTEWSVFGLCHSSNLCVQNRRKLLCFM